ncbi:MAG TPA: TetR/AcrR family transcriptional regulator [Eggerthellaceae bacterium]|nr:TetR/AcrR family transcriptional regulator [Eggerthellaceae bacterium]
MQDRNIHNNASETNTDASVGANESVTMTMTTQSSSEVQQTTIEAQVCSRPRPEPEPEPVVSSAPASGLRERKKEQTRQALEETILRLVIEKGYENVTVEEVCEQVGISRKTFFNYFSSKRAAVLGRSYIPSKDMFLEAMEKYPEANYLDVLAGCIEHGLTSADTSDQIKDLRKSAMLRSPEIFFRTNKSSLVLHPAITAALMEYLSKYPEKRKMPEQSLREECLVGTSVVICIMRTHIMLSSFKDNPIDIKNARLIVNDYLS